MSVPDPATPIAVFSVKESLVGRKVRIAGQFLAYDENTGLVLVLDGDRAVLVDVSLCLGKQANKWIQEPLTIIMVLGHVERTKNPLPIPTLPAYSPAPVIDSSLVIRALIVVQATDLDMGAWRAGLEGRIEYETEP